MKKLIVLVFSIVLFGSCVEKKESGIIKTLNGKNDSKEPKNINKKINNTDEKTLLSQYTAIPDKNFEQALIDLGYDDLIDGYVLKSGVKNCKELDVSQKLISDLTGIESFINLKVLNCSSNQLTTLDVSNNTALTYLNCSYNLAFKGFDSYYITTLDVSNNTSLTYLRCDGNKLSALDVSNNTALEELICSANQLTTLDVSNNTALTGLACNINKLTTLDVSNNIFLKILVCSSNQLTTLDVSNNTVLNELGCNINKLTTLDLSKNTALTGLLCENNKFDCDALKAKYGL